MASSPHALGFLFIIYLVYSAGNATATKNMPVVDKKQPEWLGLGHFDGTVLVPGLGRFMIPKKGSHVNPITYNPITGTNNRNHPVIPGVGGGNSYVPGGDDTLTPNPGVEVPNPAGGALPAPSSP